MSSDRVLPPAYSLVQVIERLPLHAQQKYEALKALLADSEALQRSLMARITAAEEKLARTLRQRSHANAGDLDGEVEAARSLLERLERERSKRNSVRANVEQTCSRLDVFLMQWFSGASDITPPPWPTNVPVGQREGESITDGLLRTRREIAAAQAELRRVMSAPPPSEEIKIGIIEQVDLLIREGQPRVTVDGGRVTINWPDQQLYAAPGTSLSAPSGSASKMLAWLFREPLLRKLIAEVADNEGGIPASERPQRTREIEQRIFALEVTEEKLVMAALDAGLECHRRIDASPWAILGYGVVEEAVAEAAE